MSDVAKVKVLEKTILALKASSSKGGNNNERTKLLYCEHIFIDTTKGNLVFTLEMN